MRAARRKKQAKNTTGSIAAIMIRVDCSTVPEFNLEATLNGFTNKGFRRDIQPKDAMIPNKRSDPIIDQDRISLLRFSMKIFCLLFNFILNLSLA